MGDVTIINFTSFYHFDHCELESKHQIMKTLSDKCHRSKRSAIT